MKKNIPTAADLRRAVADCRQAEIAYLESREKMREVTRAYLKTFAGRGEMRDLAAYVGASPVVLGNIKGGQPASVDMADKIAKAPRSAAQPKAGAAA